MCAMFNWVGNVEDICLETKRVRNKDKRPHSAYTISPHISDLVSNLLQRPALKLVHGEHTPDEVLREFANLGDRGSRAGGWDARDELAINLSTSNRGEHQARESYRPRCQAITQILSTPCTHAYRLLVELREIAIEYVPPLICFRIGILQWTLLFAIGWEGNMFNI